MKESYCRLRKCPRLMEEDGQPRCSQQGTDGAVYAERLEWVSPERCTELRREVKRMQRGSRPWQQ